MDHDVEQRLRSFGCGAMSLPPSTIVKWWTSPPMWGRVVFVPADADGFSCAELQIPQWVIDRVQYIMLERADGGRLCIRAKGVCP